MTAHIHRHAHCGTHTPRVMNACNIFMCSPLSLIFLNNNILPRLGSCLVSFLGGGRVTTTGVSVGAFKLIHWASALSSPKWPAPLLFMHICDFLSLSLVVAFSVRVSLNLIFLFLWLSSSSVKQTTSQGVWLRIRSAINSVIKPYEAWFQKTAWSAVLVGSQFQLSIFENVTFAVRRKKYFQEFLAIFWLLNSMIK